jgi:putative intracellular protease/amidase
MMATHRLAERERADILLVPGSTFAFMQVAQDKEVLQHIQRIDQTTKWTASVCTGAIILGAAGLLRGKQATTHWQCWINCRSLVRFQNRKDMYTKEN